MNHPHPIGEAASKCGRCAALTKELLETREALEDAQMELLKERSERREAGLRKDPVMGQLLGQLPPGVRPVTESIIVFGHDGERVYAVAGKDAVVEIEPGNTKLLEEARAKVPAGVRVTGITREQAHELEKGGLLGGSGGGA